MTVKAPREVDAGATPGAPLTLGQVLVRRGYVSVEELREALSRQARSSERMLLGEILLRDGRLTRETLLRAIAEARQLEFVEEPGALVDPAALGLVPEALRTEYRVLPLKKVGSTLHVCTSDPEDSFLMEVLARESGLAVHPIVSTPEAIERALGGLAQEPSLETQPTARDADLIDSLVGDFNDAELSVAEHAPQLEEDDGTGTSGPVVRLVNYIIASAVEDGASDIHIEPDEGSLRVRYRIDGTLHQRLSPPFRMQAAISSRIKIMAQLDISERRVPQDGEISVRTHGKAIDLRVSTLPGKFGEKVVMRVIDRGTARLGLEKLGFRPDMLATFQKVADEPHGVVLVTGPTGSGKSTTLYSVLAGFDTETMNVSTVEDPVECNLHGVHQVQTNVKAGMTFAGALRALLRQDPDIIMVGEIRDAETAQVAVQAALTGHLVLSTLHTNDAPSATVRLVNLGVEPFLVAAALRGVLAQRLVRRICSQCKTEYEPDSHERAAMGKYGEQATKLWKGTGCRRCHEMGLSGRLGIYELLVVRDAVTEMISNGADAATMRRTLLGSGFETLWDDGMKKVLAGQTTIEEVHGACRG